MREIRFALFSVTRLAGFALSIGLVVMLVLAATAQAQSPADDQYEERVAPAGPALAAAGVPVGEAKASEAKASEAKAGEAKAGGGSKAQPAGPKARVLPATGGSTLLVYVVALAASGVGLVLLRRSVRGR